MFYLLITLNFIYLGKVKQEVLYTLATTMNNTVSFLSLMYKLIVLEDEISVSGKPKYLRFCCSWLLVCTDSCEREIDSYRKDVYL